MRLLADNDVVGPVTALRRVLESDEWLEYTRHLDIRFLAFEDLRLPRDSSDPTVWRTCQQNGVVLLTANRASGAESLDEIIRAADPDSLPVITISDPQRLVREASYAEKAAVRLLDYLERLDSLRGTGRLFIP